MTAIPVAPSHIHSLDRCAHLIEDDRVWWECEFEPVVTNIATALPGAHCERGHAPDEWCDACDLADFDRNDDRHDRFPHAALQNAEADADVGR